MMNKCKKNTKMNTKDSTVVPHFFNWMKQIKKEGTQIDNNSLEEKK